jgi:hypothetical protein
VEDHDEPGTGVDRVWLSVDDKDGYPVTLSLDEPADVYAQPLSGGNVAVPHGR